MEGGLVPLQEYNKNDFYAPVWALVGPGAPWGQQGRAPQPGPIPLPQPGARQLGALGQLQAQALGLPLGMGPGQGQAGTWGCRAVGRWGPALTQALGAKMVS